MRGISCLFSILLLLGTSVIPIKNYFFIKEENSKKENISTTTSSSVTPVVDNATPAKIIKQIENPQLIYKPIPVKRSGTQKKDVMKKSIDDLFDFEIGYDAVNVRFLDVQNFNPNVLYRTRLAPVNITHTEFVFSFKKDGPLTHMFLFLEPGVKYEFQLTTKNEEFKDVEKKIITTNDPKEKPNKPKGPLRVLSQTDTTCEIMWEKSNNDNKFLEKYYIESDVGGRTKYSALPEIRYTVTKLTPGSDYTIDVFAINNRGYSDEISVNCHTNSES